MTDDHDKDLLRAETLDLFEPRQLYTVADIAKRIGCGINTVERKVKHHHVKSVRFGAKKYWGADLNRVIELETREG